MNMQNKIVMAGLLISHLAFAYTPEQIARAKYLFDSCPELRALADKDTEGTAEGAKQAAPGNWAEIVAGNKEYIEVPRTIQGVLNLEDFLSKKGNASNELEAKLHEHLAHAEAHNPRAGEIVVKRLLSHDFGKSPLAKTLAKEITGKEFADHDKRGAIVFDAAEKNNAIAKHVATFMSLSQEERQRIREIEEAGLNISQFGQGESPACSLKKFNNLDDFNKRLAFLENAFDISGALGHKKIDNIMKGDTLKNSLRVYDALLKQSHDVKQKYQDYFINTLHAMKISGNVFTDDEALALGRFAAMRRWKDVTDIKMIEEAFNKLNSEERANLVNELNITGLEDKTAIMLEYAPNLMQTATNVDELVLRMKVMNKLLISVRETLLKDYNDEVFTLNIKDLATDSKNPAILQRVLDEHYSVKLMADGGYVIL
jgi:hypothetical protein